MWLNLSIEVVQLRRDVDYGNKVWDFMGQFCNVISMELNTKTAEVIASHFFFFFSCKILLNNIAKSEL